MPSNQAARHERTKIVRADSGNALYVLFTPISSFTARYA